jgi:hypothetical protein
MKTHILIAALIVAATSTTEAKIYRWIDANGNVAYSQVPPPDSTKAEEMKLPSAGGPAVQAGKQAPEAKREGPVSADYDRKKLEGMDPALRKKYCEKAKKNIEILEKADPGSAFVTEKNEIVRFSKEERAKRLQNARKAEKAYCR